jgi:TP901 family phage tail tape measure protein
MSDFQVKVGGDFSEVLRGFGQLPGAAQQAGDGIGRSLNEPIRDSTKSLSALQNELRALKASQAKLPLDSSEYRAAGAEIDKIKTQIGALASKTTKLPVDASDAPAAANQFRLLDGVVQGIAFSLSNTLTNAAGAAVQAVSNIPRTISQFDSARAAVSTLGVNTDELGRNFSSLSRELGNNVSQVELMQAAYDVASSGFSDAASNTEVMRAAALLATGGFTDLQTAGDGLTSVLNAYGLSAADATKVTDGIIQTQNDGKIVAGEYAREIGRLAPTAKASGVSLEELNAAISGATAQGVPVGSTFAGIQQAIVSILKPSQDASKYAKELGIEWNASALQAKGLGGFLQQLVEKGAASSESIIRLTGSTEAQTALMPLLNDGLQKYNQFLDNQRTAAGTAAAASEKATATIDGSLKRLQNTISNLTVEAFQGLAPIVSGSINVITGFVEAIAAIPTPIKVLGGVLIGLAGAFTATALAVAVFNSALIQGQIASTGAAISALAATISGTLGAVVPVATVAIANLKVALIALTTTKFTFSAIGAAIQSGIVTAAQAGTLAIGKLTAAITSGALLSGIKAFAASTGAALVAMAPLALAVGAVAAAVGTWQFVLGGAQKVTDEFAESQKAVSEALVAMAADLDKTAEKAKQAQSDFLGLGKIFRDAREGWTLIALVDETKKLEQGFDQVFTSAMQFFSELKDSEQITEAQRKQAEEYIKQLEKISVAYRQQAEAAKVAAVEAARVGNADEAKFREAQARSLESNARALENLTLGYQKELGILPQKTAATQADAEAQKLAEEATKARAAAEAELNQIIATAPVRSLDAQLAVGKELIGLAKALADQEQSRFAVVKAGLEFELKSAQDRGASEAEIGRIKQGIQELDRQSAEARFKALTQQQQLETQMLALAQEKARVEADLSATEARVALLKAESELAGATTAQAKAAAEAQIALQQQIVDIRQEQISLLAQTQPLEQQSLKAQQETALNGEKSKLAQQGYKIAADGSVVATANLAAESGKVKEQAEALKTVQSEISDIIAETTLRQSTQQVAVGEKLLGLARAVASEEQSRFDLVRSNLEFELKKAEERGASESEIASIKQRIQETDKKAAEARYASLLQQQQLEAQMLEITQRKQVIEANLEVRKQQIALLEAEQKLREAMLTGDRGAIAVAGQQLDLQRMRVGLAGDQLNVLGQTLPIERQMLASQQQAAINARQAEAAQNGYRLAAATSAVSLNNLANTAGRFGDLVGVGAANQKQLQSYMSITVGDATKVVNSADQLKGALDNAQDSAGDMADGFTSTSDKAPSIVQGSRDFAGWLSGAKGFAEQIANLPLAGQMATVATSTQQAANAAKVFYEWLQRASSLPGSRWTGGPVEAGDQYRVNELGQEALLAGGRLRLINAAPNSIWRAPANGTVIPAGITARLQEQGALPGGSGGGGGIMPLSGGGSSAQLAIEVGKLRQEVGELARKQWNVNIQTRTGPTGSQVLKQMLR